MFMDIHLYKAISYTKDCLQFFGKFGTHDTIIHKAEYVLLLKENLSEKPKFINQQIVGM